MTQCRISVKKFLQKKFDTYQLDGVYADAIGNSIQAQGINIIWGGSNNGKTYGALQLAKYLTRFAPVAYNDYEEGARLTMQKALDTLCFTEVAGKFHFYDGLDFELFKQELRKHKGAKIVFINSIQHLALTKKQYLAYKEEFGKTHLTFFISHAEGREPYGKVAQFIRYDSDLKMRCEGYKLFIGTRLGGAGVFKPIVISPERAAQYWGEQLSENG